VGASEDRLLQDRPALVARLIRTVPARLTDQAGSLPDAECLVRADTFDGACSVDRRLLACATEGVHVFVDPRSCLVLAASVSS
jgi:hypothetical protein